MGTLAVLTLTGCPLPIPAQTWCGTFSGKETLTVLTYPLEQAMAGGARCYTLRNCGGMEYELALEPDGKCNVRVDFSTPEQDPTPEDFSSMIPCQPEDFVERGKADEERVIRFGGDLGAQQLHLVEPSSRETSSLQRLLYLPGDDDGRVIAPEPEYTNIAYLRLVNTQPRNDVILPDSVRLAALHSPESHLFAGRFVDTANFARHIQ